MTATGPKAETVANKAWPAFCRKKKATPWYSLGGNIPVFLPGAFTHTDGDGEPDGQDVIWFKQSKFDKAKRAIIEGYGQCDTVLDAYYKGGFRGVRLWMALQLAYHEVLHAHVPRHGTPEQSKRWLEEHCGHPRGAVAAIRHAVRTGFRTNAFSGLLRWRTSDYGRYEFLVWLEMA